MNELGQIIEAETPEAVLTEPPGASEPPSPPETTGAPGRPGPSAETGEDANGDQVEPEPVEVEGEDAGPDGDPSAAVGVCPLCQGEGVLSPAPRQSPSWQTCADCDGWGMVATGSRVPDAALIECERCQGRGYAAEVPSYAPVEGVSADTPGAIFDNISGTWRMPGPDGA